MRQFQPLYWGRLILSSTSIPPTPVAPPENLDASFSESKAGSSALALDFSRRAELTELMDEPCSYEELRACLHDIARVNRVTFSYRPTISWIEALVAARPASTQPLRVVDVGCGYGDSLRRIRAWASHRGIPVALTGIDLNPDAICAAKAATPPEHHIEWIVGDALSNNIVGEIDVVVCSLLTHRFNRFADCPISSLDGANGAVRLVHQRSSSSAGALSPISFARSIYDVASLRQARRSGVDPAQLCRGRLAESVRCCRT